MRYSICAVTRGPDQAALNHILFSDNKLQRQQNAAARLIAGTQIHERGLSRSLRDDLQWLTNSQPLQYKLAVIVHRCLRYRAPKYFADCCVPVSEVSGRHLRSASLRKLNIPRFHLVSSQYILHSGFLSPTVWNSLPDSLRDPTVESVRFRRDLKTHLFAGHFRHAH